MELQVNKRKLSGALRTALKAAENPMHIVVYSVEFKRGRVEYGREISYKVTEIEESKKQVLKEVAKLQEYLTSMEKDGNPINIKVFEFIRVENWPKSGYLLPLITSLNVAKATIGERAELKYYQDSEDYALYKKSLTSNNC